MAALELEIPNKLIRDAVLKTIETLIHTKNYKVEVKSASMVGENNFIGIIHRVYIHEWDAEGNDIEPTKSLIVKVAPTETLRRQQFLIRPAFVREIYSYEKVCMMIHSLVSIFIIHAN